MSYELDTLTDEANREAKALLAMVDSLPESVALQIHRYVRATRILRQFQANSLEHLERLIDTQLAVLSARIDQIEAAARDDYKS